MRLTLRATERRLLADLLSEHDTLSRRVDDFDRHVDEALLVQRSGYGRAAVQTQVGDMTAESLADVRRPCCCISSTARATSPAQTGVGDVVEQRDGLRDAAGSVAVSRAVFEHRGDGDFGGVERMLELPPAASRTVDAALIAGVHEAPARTGIDGQVDADTEQLALLADAAAAIRAWQSAQGSRATGYLDEAAAAALRASAADERPLPAAETSPATAGAPAGQQATSPDPPPASAEQETVFWQSVMNSSNPAELEAYLAQFPNGVFRVLAEARLAALRSPPAAPSTAAPEPPADDARPRPAAAAPAEAAEETERIERAVGALDAVMDADDSAIPTGILGRAQGIAVFPGTTRAGFGFGGMRGQGILSARSDGRWSAPAFLTLTGGSFGLQIGVQRSDIVLVIMKPEGLDNLVSNQFSIGVDAGVAAGPVGRNAAAATDMQLSAQILSYSRARGVFAGVTINGSTIRQDVDANERFYGARLDTRRIVFEDVGEPYEPVVLWRQALARYAN